MKKLVVLMITIVMSLALAACGGVSGSNSDAQTKKEVVSMGNKKVLVAYFSATGTTKNVAGNLASAIGADLYEIKPAQQYTSADLNWHDKQSRSSVEMKDENSRPAIDGKVDNMAQYDVVFIGYPIWWAEAPHIVRTFVESYDFNGKTLVPFATSGGNDIGNSGQNLAKLTKGAKWLAGERFSRSISKNELAKWANSLNIK